MFLVSKTPSVVLSVAKGLFSFSRLTLCLLFLFSVEKSYGDAEVEAIDPMTLFHEFQSAEFIEKFPLESGDGRFEFKVYIFKQSDPYNERFNMGVVFRCEDSRIVRLDRRVEKDEVTKLAQEKTYCHVGEPMILEDEALLQNTGEHLILPGFSFNEVTGECSEHSFPEAYPIEDLKSICP